MTPLPLWGDLIVGAAAVLVALATLYRYIVPALKASVRGVRALWRAGKALVEFIEEWRETGGFRVLAADILEIKRELHPNGGTSMRDSLTRSERGISDLREQVAAVTDQATAISERQEFLRAADESTAADLRRFLDTKYDAAMEANAHLRASVNELLAIPEEDDRGDQGQP